MILVTGASGYLGRQLLTVLKEAGLNVVAAGRSSIAGASMRLLELEQPGDYRDLMTGVDVVIHCAGIAHNKGQLDAYEQVNLRGSMALAEAAIACGVKRFVFVSSLNVVNFQATDPTVSAECLPIPETPYAISKWKTEQALEQLMDSATCELTIVRPGLVYDRELTANLEQLAHRARYLPFRLPDLGHRAMISRQDLCGLLVNLARTKAYESATVRWVASDGQSYSVRRIAEALGASTRVPGPRWLWRLIMNLRDAIVRQSIGSSWQSLAGCYWQGATGMVSSTGERRQAQTLEELLKASATGEEP